MFKKKASVVVLGAGPAGLLAAHAATELYHEVRVFSAPDPDDQTRVKKSELHGCQYLHRDIPGLQLGEGKRVRYTLTGTNTGYRSKVYKGLWQGSTSVDEFGPAVDHMAWDLRLAYDRLWEMYQGIMTPLEFTPNLAREIGGLKDTVLCTVPAPELCLNLEEHKFTSQSIWAMGSRTDSEHFSLPYCAPDFTVECDGTKDRGWYRAATVFGQSTIEWPAGPKPPVSGVVAVSKPLDTDCTCHVRKHWHRLGRFGLWRKGVLVHEAYVGAKEVL